MTHTNYQQALRTWVIAAVGAQLTPDLKADMVDRMANTDDFWVELEGIALPVTDEFDFEDAVSEDLEAVLDRVYQFYANRMNHAPGYRRPATLDWETLHCAFMEAVPGLAREMWAAGATSHV